MKQINLCILVFTIYSAQADRPYLNALKRRNPPLEERQGGYQQNSYGRPFLTYVITRPDSGAPSNNQQMPVAPGPSAPNMVQQPGAPAPNVSPPQQLPPQLLGTACNSNAECAGLNRAQCVRNRCVCANGFAALSNIACVPFASFLGDKCVISSQCSGLDPFAACYEDVCICEPFFHVAIIGAATSGSGHPVGIVSTGARQQVSTTSSARQSCALKRKLGESCGDSVQCRAKIWHATCNNMGRCECLEGYTAIGNQICVRTAINLGDACTNDGQCTRAVANSMCSGGQCVCRRGQCPIAVIPAPNNAANTGALQPSGRRRRAVPLRQARQAGNRCVEFASLNEACEVDHQCLGRTRNSNCTAATCQCNSGFVQRSIEVNECLPTIATLNANLPCTISQQCTATGAVCSQETARCVCADTHCLSGTNCLQKQAIGGTCSNDCQCSDIGASCTSSSCSCPSGFTFSTTTNRCERNVIRFARNMYSVAGSFCCFNVAASRCLLQLGIDPSSTETSFSYSLSSSTLGITIDSSSSKLLLTSGSSLTSASLTFTATVTSTTDSSVSDTAVIRVFSDSCCQSTVSLSQSSVTVSIIPLGVGDCTEPNALNADNILNLANGAAPGNGNFDLWAEPCGGPASTFATPVLADTTICNLDGTTLQLSTDLAAQGTVQADASSTLSCVVSWESVTGCNGLIASSVSLTVSILRTNCCADDIPDTMPCDPIACFTSCAGGLVCATDTSVCTQSS